MTENPQRAYQCASGDNQGARKVVGIHSAKTLRREQKIRSRVNGS